MINTPLVKTALIGVGRDKELTRKRINALIRACQKADVKIYTCKNVITNEEDIFSVLDELSDAEVNAAVIYLGDLAPEGAAAIFAQQFWGHVMLSAAEGAYGALLATACDFKIRGVLPYIPQSPAAPPEELLAPISHFASAAAVVNGVQNLKAFSFSGDVPAKGLYDLGIEVMERSEADLFLLYNAIDAKDRDVADRIEDISEESQESPEVISKLARFEVALTRFYEKNRGSRLYGIFAVKRGEAFKALFGFDPSIVCARLAARGIPVSYDGDIYGALSAYICQLASGSPAALVDIVEGTQGGFIGSADGETKPGSVTLFRLQADSTGDFASYLCEGEALENPKGAFAVPGFSEFYRQVLIENAFPQHTAVASGKCAEVLVDALKLLGIEGTFTP